MQADYAPILESIHPSLWRALQFARERQVTVDTEYPALSHELPGGGWPIGALVEVLPHAPGLGEKRRLAPAIASFREPIVLVEPPCDPGVQGLAYSGIPSGRMLLLHAKRSNDQLWPEIPT